MPEVSESTGYPIATVWDEWLGRNLSVNNISDQEIIPHLGANAGYRAVWITADWGARRTHEDLLIAQQISVLWLRGRRRRNPTLPEQTRMLIAVLETAHRLVAESDSPVYLRVRFSPDDVSQTILERLAGTLRDAPLQWQLVPLD